MTETLMNLAVRADGRAAPVASGVPVPGVDVRLVDDDGRELDAADGETMGEVDRPRSEPLQRLPQPAGRHRRGDARRLVPHRGPRHA